jgi:endoglucanase
MTTSLFLPALCCAAAWVLGSSCSEPERPAQAEPEASPAMSPPSGPTPAITEPPAPASEAPGVSAPVVPGAGSEPPAVGAVGIEPFSFGQAPASLQHFRRGINLGNRLESKPTEGAWGGRIEDGDMALIAARGFDHVRIPVWFSGHAQEASPFTLDAAFLARVDQVLDDAETQGLAVILTLHGYYELEADVAGHEPRIQSIWSQLAERYRERPDTLALEPFNEPPQAMRTTWNALAARLIANIRQTNPRRLLVIDTTLWADTSTLSELQLPDDANLVAAVHPYEPKLFSFQGQTWGDPSWQTGGVLFPGPPSSPLVPHPAAQANAIAVQWFADYNTLPPEQNPSGPRTIREQIARIEAYRQASGRAVMNTEWGPQDGGDISSRASLMRVMRAECEAAQVPWTIWEDPNNLPLFDSVAATWQEALVGELLP